MVTLKKYAGALVLGAVIATNAWALPQVAINTSEGTIVVDLDQKRAPKTVANFLKYVDSGFYNGTIFHRVIPGFMIQGGGFTPSMEQKKTNAPIGLEANNGLKNNVGTIAMARTDNPNSATSQFFINVKDNSALNATATNPGYAVFGKVVSGMDVVRKIERQPTTDKGFHSDVPVRPVIIKSITVLK
ncbi:MAG: peptidyl-prolyl cis-trans isomerase [Burkholderiales bacterium]|nr:peptidyl-prolyl cis-trans isomerase [Burkholderiales bacterium]